MSKYRFGLIGKSLAHSFSKEFFSDFFLKNKVDGIYENLEFEGEEELKVFFDSEIRNFRGLNVTIPYKKAVLPFMDEIDDVALKIGAVNTIKRIGSKTIGFNTDAYGFQQSIKPFLTNKHEKALVLGTGGASKAIEYTLHKLGIEVLFISRLENDLGHVFTYEEINKYMIDACKLIISFCRFLVSFLITETNIKPTTNPIIVNEYFLPEFVFEVEWIVFDKIKISSSFLGRVFTHLLGSNLYFSWLDVALTKGRVFIHLFGSILII